MNQCRVAVIDQGVDASYAGLGNCPMEEVEIHHQGDTTCQLPSNSRKRLVHGTNMAAIIHRGAPAARILSVKLVGAKAITVRMLSEAIRYCTQRADVNVINISLGIVTDKPDPELVDSCWQCHRAGKIIVAAVHYNLEKLCYPAALPFVYGVGTGLIKNQSEYAYVGEGYINILAKGVHQRVLQEDGKQNVRSGTSYAAASFTAIAARVILEHGAQSPGSFGEYVKEHSKPALTTHYPFNAAARQITEGFSLAEIASPGRCMLFATDDGTIQRVARDSGQVRIVMKYPQNPKNQFDFCFPLDATCVDGFLSPKLFTHIDTLVMGNFLKNSYIINMQFGYDLIDYCLMHDKKIVVFDEFIHDIVIQRIAAVGELYKGEVLLMCASPAQSICTADVYKTL